MENLNKCKDCGKNLKRKRFIEAKTCAICLVKPNGTFAQYCWNYQMTRRRDAYYKQKKEYSKRRYENIILRDYLDIFRSSTIIKNLLKKY